MNGTVRGGTVPITVSYRKVTRKPELKRHRRFVGFRRMMAAVAIKVIEAIEEVAYETEVEVLDGGEQQVVHWALDVEDPWGMNNVSSVRATRLPDKPAAGVSLEIVKIIDPDRPYEFKDAAPVGARAPRRPDHDAIRARMRESLAPEMGNSNNGTNGTNGATDKLREALKAGGQYDPELGPETIDDAFVDQAPDHP